MQHVGEVTHTGAMPLLPNHDRAAGAVKCRLSTLFPRISRRVFICCACKAGKQTKIAFNYKVMTAIKGRGTQQMEFTLRPGDTIVVPLSLARRSKEKPR